MIDHTQGSTRLLLSYLFNLTTWSPTFRTSTRTCTTWSLSCSPSVCNAERSNLAWEAASAAWLAACFRVRTCLGSREMGVGGRWSKDGFQTAFVHSSSLFVVLRSSHLCVPHTSAFLTPLRSSHLCLQRRLLLVEGIVALHHLLVLGLNTGHVQLQRFRNYVTARRI